MHCIYEMQKVVLKKIQCIMQIRLYGYQLWKSKFAKIRISVFYYCHTFISVIPNRILDKLELSTLKKNWTFSQVNIVKYLIIKNDITIKKIDFIYEFRE